jgi:hypothetical protein
MGSNTASLQFMITNAMKGTLIDELGFLPEEVEVMKPEVAKEVIEKRMNRPFGKRPMPDVSASVERSTQRANGFRAWGFTIYGSGGRGY